MRMDENDSFFKLKEQLEDAQKLMGRMEQYIVEARGVLQSCIRRQSEFQYAYLGDMIQETAKTSERLTDKLRRLTLEIVVNPKEYEKYKEDLVLIHGIELEYKDEILRVSAPVLIPHRKDCYTDYLYKPLHTAFRNWCMQRAEEKLEIPTYTNCTICFVHVYDETLPLAVLVRAGWQGNSVAQILDQKGILYFNALFKETDPEYISFYNIALEEFHNNVLGKAVQRNLKNCLLAVDARRNEIYQQESKKYIFESMYKLLEILFVESKKVSGTSRDKYDYIDFILGNKGLKHMMEFVDEQVVLTTIHAAKGLEWEYVIIPRLNGFAFPSSHMCRSCKEANSCNEGFDYCKFTYAQSLKKAFKEELSILYVGITRAKKNVFFTVNTGANKWNHSKTTSCLLNLEGLILEDYEWENAI